MSKSKKITRVEKKSVSTKKKPTNKPKETTSTKSKEKKTTSVEHDINQYNIGDNIIFMCLGCEINGVVIKVDKGNKLLVVKGENNIIYYVHLSKANSQFFYVI